MPQISDAYHSSSYSGDVPDLNFLPSDDRLLDLPSSQENLNSVSEVDFLRSQTPPLIPSSLDRVGPDRRKLFVLYTDMANDDFVNWWLQTDFGKKKGIHWETSRHQSDVWQYFEQVASSGDGAPKIMCKRCHKVLEHPQISRNGTSTMRTHIKGITCQQTMGNNGAPKQDIKRLMQDAAHHAPRTCLFTQELWEEQLISFIAVSRLPFQLVEHSQFRSLVKMAQLAPTCPEVPSAKTMRRRLQSTVKERQQNILRGLPDGAKLSIALDCWTSPFQQAILAITGYFLDKDWEYREILLGSEPLHGTHSGANLSTVLFDLFQQHKITERVLAIKTDNASNNQTLMSSIHESVQSLGVAENATIVRTPCIAHVIQLSLNQLLGKMKAIPKNETTDTIWEQKREIVDTLNKVRNLAIYINASPQRRETFCSLQTESPKLVPIQDVRTRWNSTFPMLRQAKRLQSSFNRFCSEYRLTDLMLYREGWRQIGYLLWITQPFFKFTTALSKTKDVTIHLVFKIYNNLFEHLDGSIAQLQRKKVPWKQNMLTAPKAARQKLRDYYAKTEDMHGHLYAIGSILAPDTKLQFFSGPKWENNWRGIYRQSIGEYFEPYKQSLAETQESAQAQSSNMVNSEIDILPNGPSHRPPGQRDELKQYLESDTIRISPRTFWKENQQRYPALTNLARDILSIPATGAGVERLFNSARNICNYRRWSLNASTIQELMMFMCTSKFDVEEEQFTVMKKYLSVQEIEAANEERDTHTPDDLDPISDNEEDDQVNEVDRPGVVVYEHPPTQPPLPLTQGRRPRASLIGIKRSAQEMNGSEDEAEPPLPTPGDSTQVTRYSTRVSKRREEDSDFEYYK
ncbi:hypothetical protein N7524_011896 [Penicillium chrysogenum]|nr:hypothetical protein N7524_011896 [Penicillium chrysogenum]